MESRSPILEAALGAVIIIVIGLFIWLSAAVGGTAPRSAARYTLAFDSAIGLATDNAVAVAGVKVGIVETIRVNERTAEVGIAIEPNVSVYENAFATVRSKTLLGEKYLDLDPGDKVNPLLPPGSVLSKNTPTVEIDQLLRSTAELLTALNVVVPPVTEALSTLEKAVEASGGDLPKTLGETLASANGLMTELTTVMAESKQGIGDLVRLGVRDGPRLMARILKVSSALETLLATVDTEAVNGAFVAAGPVLRDAEGLGTTARESLESVNATSKQLEEMMRKFDVILKKVEAIDERAIREFVQVEGVRVNVIPNSDAQRKIRALEEAQKK